MSKLKSLRTFTNQRSYLERFEVTRAKTLRDFCRQRDSGRARRSTTRQQSEPSESQNAESELRLANRVRELQAVLPVLEDSAQLVGLEIESEGITGWAGLNRDLWETKRDDSLRGEYKLECVTVPLSGDALLYAIHNYTQIAALASDPFSWRCSTHIHLNCLELTAAEVSSLMLLSFASDNYFYATGAEARRENYNCRPLSLLWPAAELCGTAARRLSRGKVRSAVELFRATPSQPSNRYVGMNWYSLSTFGTLELRHFPGSRDVAQIVRWINLATRLIRCAKEQSISQVHGLVQQGPDHFGEAVFQDYWPRLRYEGYVADWTECLEGIEHFMTYYRHDPESSRTLDGILRKHKVIQ